MKKPKIAMIVRSSNSGLGVQTRAAYNHFKPVKVLEIDISDIDGKPTNPSWYKNSRIVRIMKTDNIEIPDEILEWITDGVDMVFTVETPYDYRLFDIAKKKNVKTVMQYNHEFLDYLHEPRYPFPTVLLAPSTWHFEDDKLQFGNMCRMEYLPVPVERDENCFCKKKKARRFLHIAGWKTVGDRNGTEIVLDSLQYVTSKIHMTINTQVDLRPGGIINLPDNVDLKVNNADMESSLNMYNDYDILVLPRRYGGLTLQLNEAMSAGLVPLITNVEPQNEFLHPRTLTPPSALEMIKIRDNAPEIESYNIDPRTLATHIDMVANANKDEIQELSEYSDFYATVISWENMLPKYLRLFSDICFGGSDGK